MLPTTGFPLQYVCNELFTTNVRWGRGISSLKCKLNIRFRNMSQLGNYFKLHTYKISFNLFMR